MLRGRKLEVNIKTKCSEKLGSELCINKGLKGVKVKLCVLIRIGKKKNVSCLI